MHYESASTTSLVAPEDPPVTLTTAAATRLGQIMVEKDMPEVALRVFVSGGGCSGLQYGMGFETAPQADDHVFASSGLQVVVDPVSVTYLQGATVDFVDDPATGGAFRIDNPNATSGCGCGSAGSSGDAGGCGGGCGG
jgi:iron-sulfur cluster assembly accessory protein